MTHTSPIPTYDPPPMLPLIMTTLFIEKDPSSENPYILYFNGVYIFGHSTLEEARQHIRVIYAGKRDPTRFFLYPPEDGSDNGHSSAKPLDLIAYNLCAEERFVRWVAALLRLHGPQNHDWIVDAAAEDLDISTHVALNYLFNLTEYDPEFMFLNHHVYLLNPRRG